DHGRHHHEEDHDEAVRRYQHVEEVVVALQNSVAGIMQLHTHHDGECTTDDSRDDRENQIHRADVLVVRRIDVSLPASGVVAVISVRSCSWACHLSNPSFLLHYAGEWNARLSGAT